MLAFVWGQHCPTEELVIGVLMHEVLLRLWMAVVLVVRPCLHHEHMWLSVVGSKVHTVLHVDWLLLDFLSSCLHVTVCLPYMHVIDVLLSFAPVTVLAAKFTQLFVV